MVELNKGSITILVILLLIFGGIIGSTIAGIRNNADESSIQNRISQAVNDATSNKDATIKLLQDKISVLESNNDSDTNSGNKEYPKSMDDNGNIIPSKKYGYIIDKIHLDSFFNKSISDREIEKLVDSELDFKDKIYDYEEAIYLNNIELSTNKEDFKEDAYLSVLENGFEYKILFDNSLDTSKIDEDDTLKFRLLGEDVEITNWDNDQLTFTHGDEIMADEQQVVSYEDININIDGIYLERVYISVEDDGKSMKEGETARFGNLEIKIKEILYSSKNNQKNKVVFIVSKDVEDKVDSGESYSDDDIWEWRIDSNSIGLVLKEDFDELDDSDGYNALNKNGTICLPKDYLCIKYEGLDEQDMTEYSFELKDGLMRIRGDLQSGIKDYEEVYFNSSEEKFYEDDDMEDLINGTIMLGNSELELGFSSGNLVIDDIQINSSIDDILVNGISKKSNEDNYRTAYGIIIKDPENSLDDNKLKIIVPEEQIYGNVLIY